MGERVLQIGVSVLCLLLGFLVFLRPQRVIEFQIRFYKSINWDMKPVSLQKEIRNTKIMGIFLILCVVGAWIFKGIVTGLLCNFMITD